METEYVPKEVEQEPTPEVLEEEDELADLFEVPQPEDNDIVTDHLVEVDEEEDLSDLVDVSREDIMGEDDNVTPGMPASQASTPQYKIQSRGKRVIRRQIPPASMGEVRS